MEGSSAPDGGSVTTGFCAEADGAGFQARTWADGSRCATAIAASAPEAAA
jgi:hypothetical protein